VTSRLVLGDVANVIDDTAGREHVGLIVMSTHGRTGLERWVYGSVANKVLRMVECPLLLVRSAPVVSASDPNAVTSN
jgi:nucleotide-binding universal stress UspA family protein